MSNTPPPLFSPPPEGQSAAGKLLYIGVDLVNGPDITKAVLYYMDHGTPRFVTGWQWEEIKRCLNVAEGERVIALLGRDTIPHREHPQLPL